MILPNIKLNIFIVLFFFCSSVVSQERRTEPQRSVVQKTEAKNLNARSVGRDAAPRRPSVLSRLKGDNLRADKRIRLKPKAAVIKPKKTLFYEGLQENRIIVKFVDGTRMRFSNLAGIEENNQSEQAVSQRIEKLTSRIKNMDRYDDHLLKKKGIKKRDIPKQVKEFRDILRNNRVLGFGRMFGQNITVLDLLRKNTEVVTQRQSADLANYYWIQVKDGVDAAKVADKINALKVVEIAYIPPIPENADVPPTTPNLQGNQGYLNAAPQGVDAIYGWTQPGGQGDQIKIIDIETGWNLNHEDLPSMFISDGNIRTGEDGQHGTAVMGVMLALNDGAGVTGIVPNASGGVVSARRGNGTWTRYDVAEAVFVSILNLSPGDIILIEQHAKGPGNINCSCNLDQCGFIAMEYWQAEFDMINAASASGLIVAEAAGNGSVNLDNSRYKDRFNRVVRDSGALFIGGGNSNNRGPRCWTNNGTRLDVQGWGNNVMTTGYGQTTDASGNVVNGFRYDGNDDIQWYTSRFSGTSSATPIVAGAVASIQGWQIARGRAPLDWFEMGNLLKATGTPQSPGVTIGPLPDIRAAMIQQEADQPSLVVDNDGDGTPETTMVVETVLSMDGELIDSVPARSGFSGDRTRVIGVAGEFLSVERIKLGERSDRPCFIQAEKAHILENTKATPHENIDICGSKGPTNSSQVFVPTLTTSHDTFIHGISVCNSKTKNNTRLKGVKLYRTRVESDGSFSRLSNPVTFDRPNCDDNWRTPANCPAGSLATKIVVYIEDEGKNDVITGLGLRCKTLDTEEICISGCP